MTDPMDTSTAVGPHEINVCGAMTRGGGTCQNHPAKGATRCRFHGGASPQVKLKAARNTLSVRVAGELKSRDIEPVDDPVKELSRAVGETVAFRDICRDLLAEVTDGWTRTNPVAGNEETKAAVQLYAAAQRDATRDLSTMVKLGIQDRVAAISEMKAAAWIAAMGRLVDLARTTDTDRDVLVAQIITEEDADD